MSTPASLRPRRVDLWRQLTGKCPRCRVRYVWYTLPLVRDALCPTCMKPLERTSTRLQWPVVTTNHPRTGLLLAVQWKDEDQATDGTAIGPCWFIYNDGRREDKGWMPRARAAAYAKKRHVIFEAF